MCERERETEQASERATERERCVKQINVFPKTFKRRWNDSRKCTSANIKPDSTEVRKERERRTQESCTYAFDHAHTQRRQSKIQTQNRERGRLGKIDR